MGRCRKITGVAGLILMALFCASCGPGEASSFRAAENAPAEEDRLIIYTSHKEEVWWPIVHEFESRTGIWVNVREGGTNELLDELDEESDDPEADLIFGGGAESLEAGKDLFSPYVSKEIGEVDPAYPDGNGLWTPFSALPIVLVYNTKLVNPDDLSSWQDLMKEDFRGKIAYADPAKSGSNFTALVTLCSVLMEENPGLAEEEALSRFAAQLDGKELDSSGDVLDRVADGTCLVGVTIEDTALARISAGQNLGIIYPGDGTSAVPDGTAIVRNAKHPENARRFVDFTLSADVQRMIAKRFARRPVRGDAEESLGDSGKELPDLAELNLIDYDISRVSSRRNQILMSWAFYFGGDGTESGEEGST